MSNLIIPFLYIYITFNLKSVNNIEDMAFEVESTVVRARVGNLQPVNGDAHL